MRAVGPSEEMRTPIVMNGADVGEVRAVRFDRPLVDVHGWADPRLTRQIADVSRAAREQALAAGYAAGWAQGRRAAAEREAEEVVARAEREEAGRRQLTARAQPLLAALAQTARTLSEQITPAWDELVDTLIDGAMTLAGVGLARELASVDAEVLEALRTALRLLPGGETVTVHANPGDLEFLTGEGTELPEGLRIVADPGVRPGTVVARTPLHTLPVDLHASLSAAEEVLRP